MNFGELKTAVLSDTHREDYTAHIARFVAQAEALIATKLESYALEVVLTDADRVVANSPIYDMPSKVTLVRHITKADGFTLDQTDETNVGMHQTLADVVEYVVRPTHIVFAGNPGVGDTFTFYYFGLPAALVLDADTNALLTDWPTLYQEATAYYVFRRAQDYESAQVAFDNFLSLVKEINRRMKKLLGAARSANPYNVSFRSSY